MIRSIVVRKHRVDKDIYELRMDEALREVAIQCKAHGWELLGAEVAFDNPTLTMALVNVTIKEVPGG